MDELVLHSVISPRSASPRPHRGNPAIAHDDFERARRHVEAVVAAVPTLVDAIVLPDILFRRGDDALRERDLARATEFFERSLIASGCAAWHLIQLAHEAAAARDFPAAQRRRERAEALLIQLPGRVRTMSGLLHEAGRLPTQPRLERMRRALFAFLEGTGIVRSLMNRERGDQVMAWLHAAFVDDALGMDGAAPVQRHGQPRLAIVAHPRPQRAGRARPAGLPTLSPREGEVLSLIVAGQTTGEIAYHLGVKATTVATLVGRIFNKLGVNNRPAAVAMALRYDLVAQVDEPVYGAAD